MNWVTICELINSAKYSYKVRINVYIFFNFKNTYPPLSSLGDSQKDVPFE